jgi:hypothetical protein
VNPHSWHDRGFMQQRGILKKVQLNLQQDSEGWRVSEFPEAVLDMTLRDRFIMGFGKGPVQDRLFEEKISVSFAEAVSVASRKMATHSLQQQVQVKLEPEVLKVSQGKGSSRFKPQFKPSVTPGAQKSAKGEVKSLQ